MTKKILIAKITSPYGIKGEVNLTIFSSNIDNFENYQLFDSQGNSLKLKIISKKNSIKINSLGDSQVIARMENITDRNLAENIRNLEIFTNRSEFKETNKNEFYIVDLIGLEVRNLEDQRIGIVKNVLDHKASPILEINFLENKIPSGLSAQESIAFTNDFFPEVDIEKGFIRLNNFEIY